MTSGTSERAALPWVGPVLSGLLVGLAALLLLRPAAPVEARAGTGLPGLAPLRHVDHVIELEDGRRIARVELSLGSRRFPTRLEVRVSAVGGGVQPPPGFEGVPGSNLLTARELGAALEAGRLSAVLEVPGDGRALKLRIRPGTRRPIPIRRMDRGGELELEARSRAAHLTSLRVRTPALQPGRSAVVFLLDGRPRLRCPVRWEAGEARIEPVQTLGGLHRPPLGALR